MIIDRLKRLERILNQVIAEKNGLASALQNNVKRIKRIQYQIEFLSKNSKLN
jgi:hypothetical protein